MAKQYVIAVSEELKNYFSMLREQYSAPGVTAESKNASEKEIGNALLEFVTANRYSVDPETGDTTDLLELEIKRELALRATRSHSVKAELSKAEQTIADLEAKIAALEAAQASDGIDG